MTSVRTASISAVVLALLTMATVSHGQVDSTQTIPFTDVWSLEFGIGANLTLYSFRYADLAIARYLHDGRKVRLELRLRGDEVESDADRKRLLSDTLYNGQDQTFDETYRSVSLISAYLWYSRPRKDVSMYTGGGPQISYSSANYGGRSTSSYPPTDTYVSSTHREVEQWSAGIAYVIGVEWFFSEQMSIHAEYGGYLTYFRAKETIEEEYRSSSISYRSREILSSQSDGWLFGSDAVVFGITICF